ncbi:MAG: hypothetical protein ACR2LI_03210 [Propionibacteriaceae bacterium]
MDLPGVAAELYAAAPEDFVTLRSARAAEAKKAKDRELATAVAALRRPTRSAWLVNQLAREGATELAELLDLGEALAQAQRDAAGTDLRRLSAQRHAAVTALVRQATTIGSDRGHHASEATRQEVGQILTAALADPSLAAVVRAGVVTQAVTYGGFGPDLVLGSGPGSPRPPTSLDSHRAKKKRQSEDEQLREATEEAESAIERLAAARTAQAEAEQAEAHARALVAETGRAVADARQQLTERERAEQQARSAANDAAAHLERTRAATTTAEQAAARAAAELTRLQS